MGSNRIWAIENYYNRHLNESGLSTTIFNCADYYGTESIKSKVLLRLHSRSLFHSVNDVLISTCMTEKPDIVWIFKGIEIFPDTLRTLRRLGVILINYNPDHPFIRTSISHGGRHISDCIPLYDAHFCYSTPLRSQIEREYGILSYLLPFAYEPSDLHAQREIHSEDLKRLAMVGHADLSRARIVRKLLQSGIQIDLYGPNWNRYFGSSAQCRLFPAVYGRLFWETLLKYRIQLNLFRPHNAGSHNMRSFEIPSIGGIQLAPWSEEHTRFFEEGREIWLYRDLHDLLDKVRMLLELPDEEILEYRNAAKERCEQEDYTYKARALFVKAKIEDLFTAKQ